MKKILLSSVALMGLTAGAMAADLPSRRAPAPYVAVPVFTWTGFYVGVNAGYGFSDSDNNNNAFGTGALFAAGPVATSALAGGNGVFGTLGNGTGSNKNNDGFVGGGQVGYNYQIGNFVLGIEGDIQYTDFGNNNRNNGVFGGGAQDAFAFGAGQPNLVRPLNGNVGNVAFFNQGGVFNNRNSSDYFGTVRGRVGYAIDRLLIYGTGGVALRDTDNGNNNGTIGNNIPLSFFANPGAAAAGAFYSNNGIGGRRSNDNVGYAAGGGVEYAFTPNITAKIEGLYVNFGNGGGNVGSLNNVVGVTNLGVPVVSTVGTGRRNSEQDFAVVRAGLNYKFNLF